MTVTRHWPGREGGQLVPLPQLWLLHLNHGAHCGRGTCPCCPLPWALHLKSLVLLPTCLQPSCTLHQLCPSAASPCDRPFIAVVIKEKTKVSRDTAQAVPERQTDPRVTDGPRLHPCPCVVQDSGAAALGAGCVSTRLGSEFPCEALVAF